MNNRKSSFTKKDDDLMLESLASNIPAALGATDNWLNDADTLRIAGRIALSDPSLRKLLVAHPHFQRWVSDTTPTSPKSSDETTQWPDDRQELPSLDS